MAAAEAEARAPQPSVTPKKQKQLIVSNADILDIEAKRSILAIVIQEVGNDALVANSKDEPVVNLDVVAEKNPRALLLIYNIVTSRLNIMNRPAGSHPPARSAES
jgi:ABC-type Fe3+-citrate transport system substrate-binding protein